MQKLKFSANLNKKKGALLLFDALNYDAPLEIGKKYTLTVEELKNDRSLRQNIFLWDMVSQLSEKTNNDKMEIYCEGIRQAGAKTDKFYILSEAIEALKKVKGIRGVSILNQVLLEGKDGLYIEVFYGSSQFNVKEMKMLLDYFIKQCAENGIEIRQEDY